ncbi:hypothetical protein FB192DRAFT_1317782 [Mucor lusitanicus]|uniref:CCR4-NOT transcription complex subunit 4 n=1 Tax=Mucor circinelloides f. lusitanicus TaxID=29924 RepID=A0A8H4BT91_MUCCL|nr:hypothetical protein FB192DRAFT_1317782 [Mucor lusitanicus]
MDSDDDLDCPLCMEELDIADRNFRPCPCGYQICRFCWHHIKENLNGRCPACRREYSEEMVEFQPVSADELQRIRKEKREKEKQQKDMESANRRHLSSMRVVQKNLVYIIGLHPRLATEEIVRSNDYFGQFGKISKIVINKKPALPASQMTSLPSAAVYVTYYRKEDAAKAIAAVDGSVIADRVVRASYGTTKYCTYYLRNMTCPNPNCLYLHEQGEDMDTISKEELATGKHHMRDMLTEDDDEEHGDHHRYEGSSSHHNHNHSTPQQQRPQLSSDDFPAVSSSSKTNNKATDDSALPASASWAKVGVSSTPSTPVLSVSDAFGPTLSAAVAASQQKTQFPPMPKRKSEKKKRKEQLQQQKTTTEASTSQPATPNGPSQQQQSTEHESPAASNRTQHSLFDQGLTGFVLGQAYRDLCPLPTEAEFESKQRQDDQAAEELTLGVSALLLGDDAKAEPSPAQRNLEAIQSASTSKLIPSTIPSVLDFLTYSTPTPKYTSMFNPFAHMSMLGGQPQQQQQHPSNGGNNGAAAAAAAVLNNNLDSPIRRHSRFGFAQA